MDYNLDGAPLVPGSFVTFCGQGLMEPCAVAYMLKWLCMNQWGIFCEKVAMATAVGKTDSPTGSDYYNSLVSTLKDVAPNSAIILGLKDEIDKLEFSHTGEAPYHILIDYLDRVISAVWRGADLSTMSARSGGSSQGGGQGASLQGKEEYYIQCADAMAVNEVFNTQIDPLVLKWHFGEDVVPLVSFKLIVPPNIDANNQIAIVNALLSWGVDEIGQNQMLELFGLSNMIKGDTACVSPQESSMQLANKYMPQPIEGANAANIDQQSDAYLGRLFANAMRERETSKLLVVARDELAKETAKALKPLRDEIEIVLSAANENRLGEFSKLRAKVPQIISKINEDPANAVVLANTMAASWFNGLFAGKPKV
jgi:hypothetical protein